jgi:hypothetical protein
VAKATMHGFPIVSGEQLLGPPAAGMIAHGIRPSAKGRFAVALISTSPSPHHIHTAVTPVPRDRSTVDRYRRDGRSTARLYGELCEMHVASMLGGFRAMVPWGLLSRLSDQERDVLQRLTASQGDAR